MSTVCCEPARAALAANLALRGAVDRRYGTRLVSGALVASTGFGGGKSNSLPSSKFVLKPVKTLRAFAAVAQPQAAATKNLQEVEFSWKGDASEVLLTGSFLNWETKIALHKLGDGSFSIKQKLKPGTHSYKYIVDGEWKHDESKPTTSDGTGGFNNSLTVRASSDSKSESLATPEASGAPEAPKPAPTPAAPAAEAKAAPEAKPAPKPAAGKKAAGKKAAAKPIGEAMNEDIIPNLRAELEKEDISELDLVFEENQLRGSFLKDGVRYQFCAYFPDGNLEGVRGFSLTSRGNPFSTVEPFIIDERKVTPELVVFWVKKRLFAQKLLSLN